MARTGENHPDRRQARERRRSQPRSDCHFLSVLFPDVRPIHRVCYCEEIPESKDFWDSFPPALKRRRLVKFEISNESC